MENVLGIMCGMLAIVSIFIGLPWLIFHYVTKWKQVGTLTGEDEKLLDELHYTARRLEDRLMTIERIIAADHPDYRLGGTPETLPPEAISYEINRRN
ncbi:envelope stress response membrane protein PspB [Sphingomonas sp. GlSt437]|uniref:envelope stress response membrane protein PspB n=1 Tax=Sphingomonas sp. GlSt437 TaxID=3389970 RepID=UPI003A8B3CD3